MADDFTPSDLCALIARGRYPLHQEKATQAAIYEHLLANLPSGVKLEREVRLSTKDVPDFVVARSIAVEVKVRGARKMDVYRQLERYAEHPSIKALILVTGLSMGLPEEIKGKPAWYVSLGRSWL